MANNYESLKTDGHYTMARRIFTKIKSWVESKVGTDVPANAVFTDEKVTQTESTTNNLFYELLFSQTGADSTTHTEGARKNIKLQYNPYYKSFTMGVRQGNAGSDHGEYSFASGYQVGASGQYSFSSGFGSGASGEASRATGYEVVASGSYSQADGYYNTAKHKSQHVFGEYSVNDPSTAASTARGTYVEIVGNGTATNARSNARTLDWNGNETIAGNYYDINGKLAHKPLTQDQYNALTQAQQLDGTEYFVRDRVPLQICDYIYPVGAIYMSVTNVSPAVLFGGTWERIEDKFLLAAGQTYNVGATGGETKHTHDYGIQLGGFYYDTTWEGDSNSGLLSYDVDNNITLNSNKPNAVTVNTTVNGGNTSSNKTANTAHYRAISNTSYTSNMPPYLVVNVWMRVPDPVEEEEE